MSSAATGILLSSDTRKALAAVPLGPGKLSQMRTAGDSSHGIVRALALPQPAATLFVHRDDSHMPENPRAMLILQAADPARRGERVRGDAVLLGIPHGDGYASAPTDYTDILLAPAGSFQVEFQPPLGGDRLPMPSRAWPNAWDAYRAGLSIARALPRMSVRVVLPPRPHS